MYAIVPSVAPGNVSKSDPANAASGGFAAAGGPGRGSAISLARPKSSTFASP